MQPVLAHTLRNLFGDVNPALLLVLQVQVEEGLAWPVSADGLLLLHPNSPKKVTPRKLV